MAELAQILKRYGSAKNAMNARKSDWLEAADYIRPSRNSLGGNEASSSTNSRRKSLEVFDSTAIEASDVYAAGCMSWMTPSETTWFAYDAPRQFAENDEIKSWYSTCTDIAREILATTNFYSEIHECYFDDSAFSTCALHIEEGGKSGIHFEQLRVGTYSILEDDEGDVDTVFRDLPLTIRTAAMKFGEENLHVDHQKSLSENGKDCDATINFIHVVMPRPDAERDLGKLDASNMPYASIYIDEQHKKIVKESGCYEMPIAVHRHSKSMDSPWGWGPADRSMPDIRQLNYMQGLLDTEVERHVSPPVRAPASFEGNIDLRSGGVTFFKDSASKPEFWESRGNTRIGENRTQFRIDQINKAYHVDLFQALAGVPAGKEMTATEVNMRQRDRLTLFSPTFARKNKEMNTPVTRRLFGILLRAGAFPQAPDSLTSVTEEGMIYIPDPQITYTSRLALQIKAIHNDAYMRSMQESAFLFEMFPDAIDNYKPDAIARSIYRNNGTPEDGLRSEQERDQLRQQRAEAQAQAEEEASNLAEADAVSKLTSSGAVPPAQ